MPDNDKINDDCLREARRAIALITDANAIYDANGYLNEYGYKALETLEGLDLFWICDPLIQFRKQDKE